MFRVAWVFWKVFLKSWSTLHLNWSVHCLTCTYFFALKLLLSLVLCLFLWGIGREIRDVRVVERIFAVIFNFFNRLINRKVHMIVVFLAVGIFPAAYLIVVVVVLIILYCDHCKFWLHFLSLSLVNVRAVFTFVVRVVIVERKEHDIVSRLALVSLFIDFTHSIWSLMIQCCYSANSAWAVLAMRISFVQRSIYFGTSWFS